MSVFCDKCLQDDEKTAATHNCPTCKVNLCEGHLSFHNTSAKTKDHASSVKGLNTGDVCTHCDKFHGESWPATHQCAECGDVKLCDLHKKIHDRSPKLNKHKLALCGGATVAFSGEFQFVGKIGDKDEINIPFEYLCSIAIDVQKQLLFIADYYTIYVFDAKTHLFKYKFTSPKEEAIVTMAIDYNDSTLVFASNSRKWITKSSYDGKVVYWSKTFDREPGELTSLAVDTDSTVYASFQEYRSTNIIILNGKDGSVVGNLGKDINDNPLLSNATSISIDLDGNLCFGDGTPSYQLVTMTKKGKILKKEDRPSHNYGRIGNIIHESNGDILCVEMNSSKCRVENITKSNGFKTCEKINGKELSGSSLCIAFNSQNGELFVASRENKQVFIVK